jgi:molecular chaperone DnaK
MSPVAAIDLGAKNAVLAAVHAGRVEVIQSAEGGRLTPATVAYTAHSGWVVGHAAQRQSLLNAENTVAGATRFLGVPLRRRQDLADRAPYWIVPGLDDRPLMYLPATGRVFAPEQLVAKIVGKLHADAERHLEAELARVVLAVPATYDAEQRAAIRRAAGNSGLGTVDLVDQPVAVVAAYDLGRTASETVLVWDLGAATCDVSIVEASPDAIELWAAVSDDDVGGDDYDRRIAQWATDFFEQEHGIGLRHDRAAQRRLLAAAETARIELSGLGQTEVLVPFVAAGRHGPTHLSAVLSRAAFETLTADITERGTDLLHQALRQAGIGAADIDRVVLAGGAARMPAIERLVGGLTGLDPVRRINPEEVTAIGAAVYAASDGADADHAVPVEAMAFAA